MTTMTGWKVQSFPDDPYSDENLTDPYPLFDRMRAAGPAVWLEKYGVHAVTGYEECLQILTDHDTFISGAGVGPTNLMHEKGWRQTGILETDRPDHTPMRSAIAGVISPRNIRDLRAQFELFAAELVDHIMARSTFDGVSEIAEIFPIRVFGDAVGIPREGREQNLLAHGAMNFSQFGPANARSAHYFAAGQSTSAWVMTMTARENLQPGGLGEKIWQCVDRGELPAGQAPLLVRAMLSAGLDTTALAIGNALVTLARHPSHWASMRQNPKLVKHVIEESLRLESPFQSFYRTTSRHTDFRGIDLPAGTKVLVFLGAANRDPEHWGPDAADFRPERAVGGQLAFGIGIHHCVGQLITRLEMDVLLGSLVTRARTLDLTSDPTPYLHNTLRGWSGIPAAVTA